MIGTIIYGLLGVIGLIFLLLVVLAGLRWMTAGGNEETVANAKQSLKNAAIGVIVVLSAYAISYFIITIIL